MTSHLNKVSDKQLLVFLRRNWLRTWIYLTAAPVISVGVALVFTALGMTFSQSDPWLVAIVLGSAVGVLPMLMFRPGWYPTMDDVHIVRHAHNSGINMNYVLPD